ncbi:MAG: hypothetical protein GY730_03815 [bacterium]|nr:hypothetical protein [bacterium]
MPFSFYDVKTRKMIEFSEKEISKITYKRRLKSGAIQYRYALRAAYDNRRLTKFCSKKDWDRLSVPVEVPK